jgi:Leucine-rich repeat (LRR) protein
MLRTLVNLRLHKNDFYGDLPNFSDAVFLETAHFDDNFFKGPLPQFGSQRLRELYFDKNEITGPIPISYGSHPKLQILSARNNDLSSSIPASLGSATSLGILDLSYNKLTGELSQDLSHLSQLKKLYLNNNRLQGSFPPWVGSLSNLSIAHFNNNMFSGTLNLSYDFENLDYLTEFTIENNGIVGRMPEEVCDLLLSVLTADCLGNPAAVDCPCCTKCYGGR